MRKALGLVAFGMLCTALVAANAEQAPTKLSLDGCPTLTGGPARVL